MKAELSFYPDREVPEMVKIGLTAETEEDSQQLKVLREMKLVQGSTSSCHSLKEVTFCVPARVDPMM
jgi:hypothetical protein